MKLKIKYMLLAVLVSLLMLPIYANAYDSDQSAPFSNRSISTTGGSWTKASASSSTGLIEIEGDQYFGDAEAIIEMRYAVTTPLGSPGDEYICDYRIKYRFSYQCAGLFMGCYELKISTQIQNSVYSELDEEVQKNLYCLYSGQDNNDYWGAHDSDYELTRNTMYYLVLKVRVELHGWIWMHESPNSNYDNARFDMIEVEWSFIEV